MKKRRGLGDVDSVASTVSEQLYGPVRMMGPFPYDCRPLEKALRKQPVSDFQAGIAGALKHRFLDTRPDVDVLKRML